MKKIFFLSFIACSLLLCNSKTFGQWQLTGNSNAVATSILGTTNAIPLNLTTNNVQRMVIDANGKIGIGTATPVNILTVKGAGSTPAASWVSAGNPVFVGFGEAAVGNADYILAMASTSNNGRPVFVGRRSRGTLAVPTAMANNDFIVSMLASAHDGTAFQNPATIDFLVDGTVSAGNVPARISFVTGSNSTNRAERLKIGNTGDIAMNTNQLFLQQSTGFLGIGTVTPAAQLQLGNTVVNKKVVLFDIANNDNQFYGFGVNNGTLRYQVDATSASHVFYAGTGTTTSSEIMRIQGNGNVGIGITNPAAKLDLNPNSGDVGFHQNSNGSFMIDAPFAPGRRVAVLENGNVGIGTNTPIARLHVADSSVVFTGPSVFFNTTPYNPPVSGAGGRTMWYPAKAAFRTGAVSGTNWDKDSIGYYSFASGYDSKASGEHSIAMGPYSTASQQYAIAMGRYATATNYSSVSIGEKNVCSGAFAASFGLLTNARGESSVTFGTNTIAKAKGSFVSGMYNDTLDNPNNGVSAATDRIFQLGNGADGARSNAITILRSGSTGIGTNAPAAKLDVAGNVKIADGTQGVGRILTSDANGLATWQLPSGGSGQWTTTGNNIYSSNSGNVGIGTTTPGYRFQVVGVGRFEDGVKVGGLGIVEVDAPGIIAGRLKIDSTGRVGIGTATPTSKLDVNGQLTIEQKNFGGYGGLLIKGNIPGNAHPNIAFTVKNNAGTPLDVVAGLVQGELSNNVSGSEAMGLGFYTSQTGQGGLAQRLLIKDNGNVGIGTTTPQAKLDVNGDAFVSGNVTVRSTTTPANYGRLVYTPNATGNFHLDTYGSGAMFLNYYGGSSVKIGNGAAGVNASFLANGNVGIGTQTPANKFSVAGDANVDGTVYIRNANTTSLGRFVHSGTNGNFHIDNFGGGDLLLNYFATTNCRIGNTLDGPVASFMNNGNVGIGTSTPNGLFELRIDQGRKPSTSTWTIISDARLKNIEGAYTKGLAEILKLNPITYHYKNDGNRKFDEKVIASQSVGFTAQEVQKVFPEAVGTDPDGYLNLNIHPILVASINAFKEQQKQIETLSGQVFVKDETIQSLQHEVAAMRTQMNEMMKSITSIRQSQEACCNVAQTKPANQNETVENVETPVLEQNAPNPVSNTTVIRYKLPSTVKEAQIIITDSKGTNLKSIKLSGKPIGQVTLSAGTLAPGTYFYTLIADSKKADTKEMQIVR